MILDVTVAGASGSVQARINQNLPAPVNTNMQIANGVAQTAVGVSILEMAPGASGAVANPNNARGAGEVPHRIALQVIHSGADSWTYSLHYVLIGP